LTDGAPGIKAVIFDLGNVLVDFDHLIAARKILRHTSKTPEELFSFFFDSDITRLFEAGAISAPDFFLKVKEAAGLGLGYEEFVRIWNGIFFLSEKNRRVLEIARKLKNRYKTAFLSNINILHLDYIKENFAPVVNGFDFQFYSCECGFVKPQEQIYRQALEAMGVSANEAFYTDDRQELVEGARKLGIKGFVFSGPEQLEKDLAGSGVEIGQG